jgi:NADH-quinone oxidoreductase subunit H
MYFTFWFIIFILGILGFVFVLILNIVLMLLVTLIIASLTLIERKFLSLLQRRVGPNYVGYKGRLQYIADALKLFVKGIIIPYESNKF